jgi:hypothetical protein
VDDSAEPITQTWLVDDFKITMTMTVGARAPVVRELHVEPRPDRPDAAITTRWLRSFRLGDLADVMVTAATQGQADEAIHALVAADDPSPELRAALVARAYLAALAAGAKQPTRLLAEELGLTIHAMRQRIAYARKIGVLTEAEEAGKAGGQLTALGQQLLAEHEQES